MTAFAQVNYPLLSEIQVHASETLNCQFIKGVKSKVEFNDGYNGIFSLSGLFSGNQYYQGQDFLNASGVSRWNLYDTDRIDSRDGRYYVDINDNTKYVDVIENLITSDDIIPNATNRDDVGELCPYLKTNYIVDENLPTNVHRDDECDYTNRLEDSLLASSNPFNQNLAHLLLGDVTGSVGNFGFPTIALYYLNTDVFINSIGYALVSGSDLFSPSLMVSGDVQTNEPYKIGMSVSPDIDSDGYGDGMQLPDGSVINGFTTGNFDQLGVYKVALQANFVDSSGGALEFKLDFSSFPNGFVASLGNPAEDFCTELDADVVAAGSTITCSFTGSSSVPFDAGVSTITIPNGVDFLNKTSFVSDFFTEEFNIEVVDDKQLMAVNDLTVSEATAPRSEKALLKMANAQIMEVEEIIDRDNVEYIGQTFDPDSATFEVDVDGYNYSNPRAGSYNAHVTSIDPITGFEVECDCGIEAIDAY